MKASELRIGNYVHCRVSNDAGVYKIDEIAGWQSTKEKVTSLDGHERIVKLFGGARDGERHGESKIKGIPLTEEWLLMFGFDGNKFSAKKGEFNIWTDTISDPVKNDWYFVVGKKHIKIHCVHQLQNLYFALTGTELELK